MSTDSEKLAFDLDQYMCLIARNSGMFPDSNYDQSTNYFSADRHYPNSASPLLVMNLRLMFSDTTKAWYVWRFDFRMRDHRGSEAYLPVGILDGTEVLRHHGKRPATPEDMWAPGSVLWKVNCPANLEALFAGYIDLTKQNGKEPILSLYPTKKDK